MTANAENLAALKIAFLAIWLDDSKQIEATRIAHQIDAMKTALYGPSDE